MSGKKQSSINITGINELRARFEKEQKVAQSLERDLKKLLELQQKFFALDKDQGTSPKRPKAISINPYD
ncbi:hypothetical protein HYV71_00205 [Candidatus Uhrbacteria bacterium]|nr:hypothetical protein [Candidatus Uhrbacteria bacterium]